MIRQGFALFLVVLAFDVLADGEFSFDECRARWTDRERSVGNLAFSRAGIRMECDGAAATFSTRNGALQSFVAADGIERVRPAAELFTLCFLDESGNETVLKSSDFAFRSDGGRFDFTRDGGPSVSVAIRAEKGVFLFRPTVRDWPRGLRLNWIDVPEVCVSTAGRLYWPFLDGCEVSDYTTRTNSLEWNRFRHAGWIGRCMSSGGYYPGRVQMQFLAHYRDGKGLYFGSHDEKHTQKLVEWEYVDPATARLTLETLCGDARNGVYESAFEYRLCALDGDWMSACELYRDWVRTLPEFQKPPDLPDAEGDVTIAKLEVAPAGAGRLEGFAFAENGTVNLTGVERVTETVVVPMEITGDVTISDWSVTANGNRSLAKASYADGKLTIEPSGTVILVR